jgi:hypothetical protein
MIEIERAAAETAEVDEKRKREVVSLVSSSEKIGDGSTGQVGLRVWKVREWN